MFHNEHPYTTEYNSVFRQFRSLPIPTKMKLVWLLLVTFAIASNLLRVNDKNFKEVVKDSGKFTLVDFYADWCRHCMNLMPTIEKLADIYADVPEVQIVKINGDEDGRKMTTKYDIPGFPYLLMFHGDSQPIEFEGMRDVESISNFVQQVSGIKLGQEDEKEISPLLDPNKVMRIDDENFQTLVLEANYKTIIIFTAPWCRFCKEIKPIWFEIANKIFDSDSDVIRFGEVDLSDEKKERSEKIQKQFGIKLLPTIMLFDPFKVDEDGLRRPVVYNDDRNLEFLVAFINDETGLSRNYEGKLFSNAGRIMSIDEAINSFRGEGGANLLLKIDHLENEFLKHGRDALVDQNVLFYKDDLSMLPFYRKVVNKLINDEKDYFLKEIARLKRILSLEEKNIERSAYDYMQKRLNVLEGIAKMRKF